MGSIGSGIGLETLRTSVRKVSNPTAKEKSENALPFATEDRG